MNIMKKLLILLLTLAMTLSLPACAPKTERDGNPTAAYQLEKINEINDMVLDREIIPSDYLRYLPDEVTALIENYNKQTAELHLTYTRIAEGIASSHFYEQKSDPGDYDQSLLYYEWIGRIARYALYENAGDLCYNDPCLAYPLMKEAGGSWGMWAERIHVADDDARQRTEDYFELIHQLLDAMDDARETYDMN